MTNNQALLDAVRVLARARTDRAEVKAMLANKRELFAIEHESLIHHADMLAEDEEQAERTVRALAVSEYEATGEQKPCEGISIVLTKVLDYKSDEATAWAVGAMPALIVPAHIDVKAFDKVARAVSLPFVTVTETPAVRIASTLEVTP